MDSYEAILNNAVTNLEALINEVDTEVRAEFPECDADINLVVDGLRALDVNDYWHLMHQMNFTQRTLKMAAECTCEEHARFHVCLSRVNTSLMKAAYHTNVGAMKIAAEAVGMDFSELKIPKFEDVDPLEPIVDLPSGIKFDVPDTLEFEIGNDNG